MDLGLKDKVAIVTGSSRGIGRSIAMGLADEGCKLVICARGEEKLQETAKEIREKGVDVVPVVVDIVKKEGANRVVDLAKSSFERVDVLVNNVSTLR